MLIISDESLIGDSLSGLPFIYHTAAVEARAGRTPYLVFRNREVLSLIPPRVLDQVRLVEDLPSLFDLDPRLAEQRIAHLYVRACHLRYGTRYHMMHAHFINNGSYPEHWEAPQLDLPRNSMTQEFDFIISPYTRSDSSNNKLWPYERWQALVDRLLPLGTVCVLGAEGDPQVFGGVTYLFDRPLREVCGHIANVRRLVLSLDNGISHIAHSLRVPHFMFYPVTHSPIWTENRNANAVRIVAPPLTVSVDHAWATIESALQQPYSA